MKDVERSKAPDCELGFHVLEEIGKCLFVHNDIYYSNWQKKGQSCVSILQHERLHIYFCRPNVWSECLHVTLYILSISRSHTTIVNE